MNYSGVYNFEFRLYHFYVREVSAFSENVLSSESYLGCKLSESQ